MTTQILTIGLMTHSTNKFNMELLPYPHYVHAPQFKVHGIAVCHPDQRSVFRTDVQQSLTELQSVYGQRFESVTLAMHNAVFTCYVLKELYGIAPAHVIDTKMMSHLVDGPTHSDDLHSAAWRHQLSDQKGPNFRHVVHLPSKIQLMQLGRHASREVKLIRQLADCYLPNVNQQEVAIMEHTVRIFLNPVLQVDTDILNNAKAVFLNGAAGLMAPYAGRQLRRQAEFMELLPIEDEWFKSAFIGDSAYATDDERNEFLQSLADTDDPAILELLKKRHIAMSEGPIVKLCDSLIGTANQSNGKLPVQLVYGVAISGRFAGRKPNLQGLPVPGRSKVSVLNDIAAGLRRAIHAPDGYALIAVDAAQIEARILAWLTGEEDLCRVFAEGLDVYANFAESIFNEPVRKASGDSPEEKRMRALRLIGKTAILGLGYRMGARKFKDYLKKQAPELIGSVFQDEQEFLTACGRIVDSYRRQYKKISAYWTGIESAVCEMIGTDAERTFGRIIIQAEKNKVCLQLPSKRRITYTNPVTNPADPAKKRSYLDRNGELAEFTPKKASMFFADMKPLYGGMLTENTVQGIARDLLVDTILEVEAMGYPVVLHIHDEIICMVPEAEAELAKQKMILAWKTVPAWADGLVLDAEGKIGKNMLELK